MELLQYWRIIRKRWWMVVLVLVLGVASTAVYTLQQPPEYQTTATLLLNPAVPSSLVPFVQTQVASGLADSYTQLIRTRSFADTVLKEGAFSMSPDDFGRSVSTRLEPNTLFYKITARAHDAHTAQQLVNTVVKVFLSANEAQQRAQASGGANSQQNEMETALRTKLTYLGDQIKAYQGRITDLENQSVSAVRDDQLLQLRGQLVSIQQSETEAMVALAGMNTNNNTNTALVIDPAQEGQRLSSGLSRNLLLAFVGSLVLGVGLVFVLNYLDYTVRSPEYLEQVLGLTPMAVIGDVGAQVGTAYARIRKRGTRTAAAANVSGQSLPAGKNLVTLEHPKSPDSESFRVLRTNIQFSSPDKPLHQLIVTSGGPAEGKSFTAANLAIVMAQSGLRVILVDTDLRRPSLHRMFGLPNTQGFTNLVVSSAAISDQTTLLQDVSAVANLQVLTSGHLPPNPSELLNSAGAAKVMTQLHSIADMVIYDTPPVTVVTDAAILATRVDGVIYVINARLTRRFIVEHVLKILETVGVERVLPVLNRVKLQDIQGSSYYYYHQHYGPTGEFAPSVNGYDASSASGSGEIVDPTPSDTDAVIPGRNN